MYTTIKKFRLSFIFLTLFMSQNLMADILFYYNAAVLPAIIASQKNPVADAGPDQYVSLGDPVMLDGSNSSDTLTYLWTITSKPAGSSATLSDPSVSKPTFTADITGRYEIQLIVNNGSANSALDAVSVTASTLTTPPSPPAI